MGYADEAGIPLRMGLIRNHYVGRTFIQPQSSIRHFGVKVKLNPVRSILDGKRVVLVDDSIVRGTTCRKIVRMVRAAGAKEVHVRISCPPTMSPCFYGIDTPRKSELIAATHTLEEIRDFLEADSVGYLSLAGLHDGGRQRSRELLHVVLHGSTRSNFRATRPTYLQLALKLDQEAGRQMTGAHAGPPTADPAVGVSLPAFRGVGVRTGAVRSASGLARAVDSAAIDKLGDLDYDTRTGASRTVRRTARRPGRPRAARGGLRAR